MVTYTFPAIGTHWKIDIFQDIPKEKEADILSQIQSRIDIFDKAYSRFRDDSLVTLMSKKAGVYTMPADAERMMSLYRDLYERTDGLVTPLIGNLISDAGYDAQYSLKQKKGTLHSPPVWEEAIEYVHPRLVIKKPVLLDFGAAGKGYLIDLVAEVCEANSVHEYCIDAGGDIFYKNKTPLRVGLEDPDNLNQVIGICTLLKGSICGSAGNRRAWENFTHIINPHTLLSPKDISAVWVTAQSALLADALTTCLFFVEPQKLTGTYSFQYVIMRSDRSVEKSEGFPGELFVV